jgi:hypothetical protein
MRGPAREGALDIELPGQPRGSRAELEEWMRLADHGRTARRRLPYLALALVAIISAAMLSQCKIVDERLTGVANPFQGNPASCISDCAQAGAQALREESDLHTRNVKSCADDPTCLALEEARHEQAIAQINSDREQCKNNCHHQGFGSGGR